MTPPHSQIANVNLTSEEKQGIGEAVLEALAKFHDQPVLYLMDLVNVEIPLSHPNLRDKFNVLLKECSALRCSSCKAIYANYACHPIIQ